MRTSQWLRCFFLSRLFTQRLYDIESSSKLQSVTHEGDLDEFLSTAQLAATDFTAGRQNLPKTLARAPGC